LFNQVHQDRGMARPRAHCPDANRWRLINRFLKAGVRTAGQLHPTTPALPQGGARSPVLASAVRMLHDEAAAPVN
jgi:hypothetical protein